MPIQKFSQGFSIRLPFSFASVFTLPDAAKNCVHIFDEGNEAVKHFLMKFLGTRGNQS
jgi:hypothetical protein